MSGTIPILNKKFACIVDWKRMDMAAIISSYLSRPGIYVPFFEFPTAKVYKEEINSEMVDEHMPGRVRSDEFDVFTGNAIARMGGCENLILAGLTAEQKSYLGFLEQYNVIEINGPDDIDFFLSGFRPNGDSSVICRPDQILLGLYWAIVEGSILMISETADAIVEVEPHGTSLVVIEDEKSVSTILAINYSCAVRAAIKIVKELEKEEPHEILQLIEGWQEGKSMDFDKLTIKVMERVGTCQFTDYESVTFFTDGLPYSLIIKNVIPCCYIHLLYRPDFFIFNAIIKEEGDAAKAALVFSPGFFKDEETSSIISILEKNEFYVRSLLAEKATVYNLDMNVKEFPYDLFHICSHGGEVDGYSLKEEFVDRDGIKHTIEYDEVIGLAPQPGKELIPVHRKTIFRKFDNLPWGSKTLKEKKYAHYVFADMQNSMRASFKAKGSQGRVHKPIIPDSCAIKCHFSIYQAMLQSIAAYSAPIIFNNSCWSWSGISDSFLVAGARGYIGTLWSVNTRVASDVAKEFYSTLFQGTVLDAIHVASRAAIHTDSEYIYMYWGLPFVRLRPGLNAEQNKYKVFLQHYRSVVDWNDKAKNSANLISKKIMDELSIWNATQIKEHFDLVEMKRMREKYGKGG